MGAKGSPGHRAAELKKGGTPRAALRSLTTPIIDVKFYIALTLSLKDRLI